MNDLGYSPLARYFSEFLARRSGLCGKEQERFQDLVARVCMALEEGNSCLPLNEGEEQFLAANPLVSRGGLTPLIIHKCRLYLHRYFHYESRLAEQISQMATIVSPADLDQGLIDRYFNDPSPGTDWQKEAAKVALRRALTIISGGPGTGKTTTVVKILALLLETAEDSKNLSIALAAPTGKAAMRLSESMSTSLTREQLPERVKNALPTLAVTLHRLLGVRRGSVQMRHNLGNPLSFDVVVVDEASMVDLAMMAKLVDAVKPGARLILLGDKDQLASVESGAVFGDCVSTLPDNVVELQKTFRFEANIKQLAVAINRADASMAWGLLEDSQTVALSLLAGDPIDFISQRYISFMETAQQNGRGILPEIFSRFNSFRVLCALHYGRRGVEYVNRQVEVALSRRGFACSPDTWYVGRPVLITRNDYDLDLYNGDIGICLPEPDSGQLQVFFERAGGKVRGYPPSRLPSCQTVFAMTIHKSQGSEFDEVLVVLPEEDNRILSRELVYTGITRAKKKVILLAEKEILRLALTRNIVRASGLTDFLREKLRR